MISTKYRVDEPDDGMIVIRKSPEILKNLTFSQQRIHWFNFSSYIHTYQSSVSFDVGFDSKSFSLGIAAHKDVQKVYEAIESKGQAIGISESWWGIFEASLPPPFLMTSRLSPMFKQTTMYLKQIGKAKSETHQRIYNQVRYLDSV